MNYTVPNRLVPSNRKRPAIHMALLVIHTPSSVDQCNSSPYTQGIPQPLESRRTRTQIAHSEGTYPLSPACRFLGPTHRYCSKKFKEAGQTEQSGSSIMVNHYYIPT